MLRPGACWNRGRFVDTEETQRRRDNKYETLRLTPRDAGGPEERRIMHEALQKHSKTPEFKAVMG